MTTNPDQRPHAWLAGSAMRAASDAGLGLVLLCAGAAAILAVGGMVLRRGFALGPGFFPTVIGWLLVAVRMSSSILATGFETFRSRMSGRMMMSRNAMERRCKGSVGCGQSGECADGPPLDLRLAQAGSTT